jgi:LPS export ABC transporter protein LptC
MQKISLSFSWMFLVFTLMTVLSCAAPENGPPAVYNGPLNEGENIETHYIEKNSLKLKMQAKKILQLQNGDQDFPDGLYLEFYDEFGNITSTLRADQAYQFKAENKWRGRGNVIIKNLEKNQQLNTEELFWNPGTKKIFTDKFVTIKTDEEIIYGTGLDALQDLSDYKIAQPKGVFDVKD